MIKIHPKIWYVIKPSEEDNLAYMCPYSETLEGKPDSKTTSMQSTGRGWADGYNWQTKERTVAKDFTSDNTPQTGLYVGNSVSRWSTSNKLFRVKDPRGFTVEIPTDNLATLLHHTTVINGFVQEECVWGREGNSHILLPVNSQPYLDTLEQMDVLENKLISIKDLKKGDVVKFFEDKQEYQYVGKVKGTWEVIPYKRGSYYGNSEKIGPTKEVEDDKWTDVFVHSYSHDSESKIYVYWKTSKPKIVSVVRNEPVPQRVFDADIHWYCPERVSNKVVSDDFPSVKDYKLLSIKVKE